MKPFNKCPICGNELIEKDVEKILRGGKHTAIVTVRAEVCQHCGERLYSEEQVRLFEQIRTKLAKEQTQEYELMGKSYYVPLD
ncbi:MAG: YgiT-type zinc finger protein [Candidatus Loosdrechtia sp.]|uniref:YgiT-type zinc finger protein n=1 Tax=Candidatus Loosdrechtia sp. TaxID=3101272 RepID=UPI003A734E12|nr:MAG: YgiT-type zinc finger protein [Candidatus Jettenia sp. AMX2]